MSQILRFSGSLRRDPAVDHWMEEHSGELGAIAQRSGFAYVNAFTAHVNVAFFRGAEIADPEGLLEGTGRFMRHVKLRPDDDVDARALVRLINTAYADIKERLKLEADGAA